MKAVERKPRRIAVAVLSVIVIAIMWIKKDVLGLWSGISSEDLLPMLATNAVVIIVRIAVLAGIVYLVKMLFAKMRNGDTAARTSEADFSTSPSAETLTILTTRRDKGSARTASPGAISGPSGRNSPPSKATICILSAI